MHKSFEYSNTITAGLGMLLSYMGFIFILIKGIQLANYWNLAWSIVYGITLILLHTSSTLYHGSVIPKEKKIYHLMDKSCIYLLIAGTYTPIALINLYGTFGITIVSIIWSLAILGIVLKIKSIKIFPNFEVFLYLFMGWFALIGINRIMNTMDMNGIILIFTGGLLFSTGVVFYVSKSLKYGHAIWHLFYISGCICHYFTILFYAIPSDA